MGIRRLAAIMTSWVKISGSTLFFVVLIGLGYGAPPLDISEFFGAPAEAAPTPPVPESKARSDTSSDLSELLAKLGGQNNALRALAIMLNPSHSQEDENSDDDVDELLSYFGDLDLDKEPEDIITDVTVNCRKNGGHKSGCEENKQCYWLQSGKHDGKCIHQTERLYNALYKKLNTRGKKDLAIQVFYNSRPAKVKLPHGIYGPHITGAFHHIQKLQPYYKPIGYNSYLNSYGHGGYNHYGYGQGYGHGYGNRGYGHGYGGYGHGKGGYGHDNSGEVHNNDTSDNDNGGDGQDNGGDGQDNGGEDHGSGGYGHVNGGYGHGHGGYGHGHGEYGHDNGGYGHGHGGYGHDNGGYGYGSGGYGGGHSHTEYSGPSYGHQGHSSGYSAGPS